MNSILLISSYFLGGLVLLTTLLSILPIQKWWSRICDFVPLQLLVMGFSSLVLFLIAEHKNLNAFQWIYLVLLVSVIIYHLVSVYPYTIFHRYRSLPSNKISDKSNQVSMVYCNVLMENRQSERLLNVVRSMDADILLFAETDVWWHEKLQVLKEKYEHFRELPLPNTYGMLFYSRLPFESKGFEFLIENDVPSLSPVLTLRSGQKVQCYFIHPKPPVPGESDDSKERDAELLVVAKKARASKLPVIVAGDLNDVGWSPSSMLFQKNGRLLDPRIGRGLFATYHAKYPVFRWPLDHIFHSDHFRVSKIRKLGYTGSDHFPIYVKLSYEPDGKNSQNLPDLDKEDINEANEKMDPKE